MMNDAIDEIEAQVRGAVDRGDPEELAQLVQDLKGWKKSLSVIERDARSGYVTSAGERRMSFEGAGTFEVMKKTKRTGWQTDELWKRVVARARDERKVDHETGEMEDPVETISRVLFACLNPSWRLEPLRALGIDPDEFCSVHEDGWDLKITS